MTAPTLHPEFSEFLSCLRTHRVRFIVVGAHALAVLGRPRATQDIDILVEPTPANARRLARALSEFGFAEYAKEAEAHFSKVDRMATLGREPIRIDVLSSISGVRFAEAWRGRVRAKIGGAVLPFLGDRELHAGIVIAVVVAIGAWFLLYRTAEGLRLRATGFNASAATWAGVNVNAQLVRAMGISGAMAGLAGGIELLGVTHRLFERFAAGYGYAGIAVALLAQLHPLGTIAAAFFFGALTTGAGELQRTAGLSSTVATFGQAVVILSVIAFTRRRGSKTLPGQPAGRQRSEEAP